MFWLKIINSNINWIEKHLTWRFDTKTLLHTINKFKISKFENIVKNINKKLFKIFCVYIKSMLNDMKHVYLNRQIVVVATKTIFLQNETHVTISSKYQLWKHLFSKKRIYKFFDHIFFDHVINLKKKQTIVLKIDLFFVKKRINCIANIFNKKFAQWFYTIVEIVCKNIHIIYQTNWKFSFMCKLLKI